MYTGAQHPVSSSVRAAQALDFYAVFCRSLFVILSSFLLPLCCLSFDLRNLVIPLVSLYLY
jgi:hypothetical protein